MTIINRDTGDNQWAYKGLPLYFLASDNNIGDIGDIGGL
jgi:predicted lipoprotein with Yx(FWY)xxD motif